MKDEERRMFGMRMLPTVYAALERLADQDHRTMSNMVESLILTEARRRGGDAVEGELHAPNCTRAGR